MPKKLFTEKTPVITRTLTYHIFETDDDGRLREPTQPFDRSEHVFNIYGYDTPEEAYVAIERQTKYGAYFVIAKMNINTDYI